MRAVGDYEVDEQHGYKRMHPGMYIMVSGVSLIYIFGHAAACTLYSNDLAIVSHNTAVKPARPIPHAAITVACYTTAVHLTAAGPVGHFPQPQVHQQQHVGCFL